MIRTARALAMLFLAMLVLAWSVVAVAGATNQTCITMEAESVTKPTNESLNAMCTQCTTFSDFFALPDQPDGFYRVYLSFCEAGLAPISYSLDDGSEFTPCALCNTQDDGVLCIEKNVPGVQTFKGPAGVIVKIGTKELYIENITRPMIVKDYPPSDAAIVATTTVLVILCIIIAVGIVVAIVGGVSIYCYRKENKRLKQDVKTLRDTIERSAAGPSPQQIRVDPEPTDETDDPPAVNLSARTSPIQSSTRSFPERPSSQTTSEPASPLHVAPAQNMPTSESEEPATAQAASRVRKDSSQKDTTAIV